MRGTLEDCTVTVRDKEELLPCPFCGGPATYMQHRRYLIFWIQCDECAVRTTQRHADSTMGSVESARTMRKCAADWNNRVAHGE